MATSRSPALLPLAVAGVLIARLAAADSLNLLKPGLAAPQSILFDHIHGPWPSDDQATAIVDADCVAITDRDANAPRTLGTVMWRGQQPAWRWNLATRPDIVYVLCADRRAGFQFDGGLQLTAALSWSARPNDRGNRGSAFSATGNEPSWISSEPPIAFPPAEPDDLPAPVGGTDIVPPGLTFDDLFVNTTGGNPSGPGGSSVIVGDAPLALAPVDTIPTPEPGTLVLMGTGLIAAWRIARRTRAH